MEFLHLFHKLFHLPGVFNDFGRGGESFLPTDLGLDDAANFGHLQAVPVFDSLVLQFYGAIDDENPVHERLLFGFE
jgi:hypothetical protein